MSVTKQTDRVQIEAYGRRGVELFNDIQSLLEALIDEAANVAYRGANALTFKTKTTKNAVDFAGICTQNMQSMSEAITQATTGIAQALGGAGITLEPPAAAPTEPPIDADTSVESATDEPLRELARNTGTTYDNIQAAFDENLTNFQNLGDSGWMGPEYDEALNHIVALTTSTSNAIDQSRTVMQTDINNQLAALGFAPAA